MNGPFPLRKALEAYAALGTARFHMPGHKGLLDPLDVTEIPGTDNLHRPTGAILESESLAASALGAKEAFYVINGSSAANHAMLALLGGRKKILLGRNCHHSVISGLAFADHSAVPLYPDERGVFSPGEIAEKLDAEPCCAVFITSPTYRGCVSPIGEIAKACHERGALLLVDCAHGAHFAFSKELPPVPAEADLWCVSTHKTLAAMTQTAVLLAGGSCPFSRGKIQSALDLFQSTSPSYPLLLSIESSVLAHADWDAHLARIKKIAERLKKIEGVKLKDYGYVMQDPTRLNLGMAGMKGSELRRWLEEKAVYPEMDDPECVTLITTPEDRDEWYERLIAALSELPRRGETEDYTAIPALKHMRGEAAASVRDAVLGEHELVRFEDAAGRVSARAVGFYPPGSAILFPGERICSEALELLASEMACGADVFGLDDGSIAVLKE